MFPAVSSYANLSLILCLSSHVLFPATAKIYLKVQPLLQDAQRIHLHQAQRAPQVTASSSKFLSQSPRSPQLGFPQTLLHLSDSKASANSKAWRPKVFETQSWRATAQLMFWPLPEAVAQSGCDYAQSNCHERFAERPQVSGVYISSRSFCLAFHRFWAQQESHLCTCNMFPSKP